MNTKSLSDSFLWKPENLLTSFRLFFQFGLISQEYAKITIIHLQKKWACFNTLYISNTNSCSKSFKLIWINKYNSKKEIMFRYLKKFFIHDISVSIINNLHSKITYKFFVRFYRFFCFLSFVTIFSMLAIKWFLINNHVWIAIERVCDQWTLCFFLYIYLKTDTCWWPVSHFVSIFLFIDQGSQ